MTVLRQLLVRCHFWLAQQWESGTRCALLDRTSSGTPRRSFVGCLFAFMFTLTSLAPAAVIERDWREPGDGLLTFDTVHQREWLDLSQTLLVNFPDFSYDEVIAELEPGGRFAGFTVARRNEVVELARSAGIDVDTLDFATNNFATGILIDLLGPTFGSPVSSGSQGSSALGFVDDFGIGPLGEERAKAHLIYRGLPAPAAEMRAGLATGIAAGGDLARPASIGVMMYRQIPEPSGIALGTCILLTLMVGRLPRSKS